MNIGLRRKALEKTICCENFQLILKDSQWHTSVDRVILLYWWEVGSRTSQIINPKDA